MGRSGRAFQTELFTLRLRKPRCREVKPPKAMNLNHELSDSEKLFSSLGTHNSVLRVLFFPFLKK